VRRRTKPPHEPGEALLVKDNHLRLAGGIGPAVALLRKNAPPLRSRSKPKTLDDVRAALDGGVTRIMFDNIEPRTRCEPRSPWSVAGPRPRPRAGSRWTTWHAVGETGVDFVSLGALTHSARTLDVFDGSGPVSARIRPDRSSRHIRPGLRNGAAAGNPATFAALQAEIRELARANDAVILAHSYERAEIQDVADNVGDSLNLSRAAATATQSTIVFCGVSFMAETAKILSRAKRVLLPASPPAALSPTRSPSTSCAAGRRSTVARSLFRT